MIRGSLRVAYGPLEVRDPVIQPSEVMLPELTSWVPVASGLLLQGHLFVNNGTQQLRSRAMLYKDRARGTTSIESETLQGGTASVRGEGLGATALSPPLCYTLDYVVPVTGSEGNPPRRPHPPGFLRTLPARTLGATPQ